MDTATEELSLGSVAEAMTRDVVCLPHDMDLADAMRAMERADVGGAPVVDGRRVVGVVTMKDIVARLPIGRAGDSIRTTGPFHRWEHVFSELLRHEPVTVEEVMAHHAVVAHEDMALTAAVRMMVSRGMDRLPVVDTSGAISGILSRDDVMRAIARAFDPASR